MYYLLFCWDTHLVKVKNRNILLVVNRSNRYAIAMTDIELRNWNYYKLYIGRVIQLAMQEMGYSPEQIEQYLKIAGEIAVTKTHGKKSVGGIDRMVIYVSQKGLMFMIIQKNFFG